MGTKNPAQLSTLTSVGEVDLNNDLSLIWDHSAGVLKGILPSNLPVPDQDGVFYASRYGATGDGVTDDTAAIAALRAAANSYASGGYLATVIFDPGTYKVTNASLFEIFDNLSIVGYGATIYFPSGGTVRDTTATQTYVYDNGLFYNESGDIDNFSMYGLYFNIDDTRVCGVQIGISTTLAGSVNSSNIVVEDCTWDGGSPNIIIGCDDVRWYNNVTAGSNVNALFARNNTYLRTVPDGSIDIGSFGAVGGSASTLAISAALAGAGDNSAVLVPSGTSGHLVANVSSGDEQTIYGFGTSSKLTKNANGPVITLGDQSNISDLRIDGEGATYTGVGVTIPATIEFEGNQRLSNLTIEDTASYCVEYSAEFAGYGSVILNCTLKPTDITTYAVKWGEETASNHHGDRAVVACNAAYGPLVDATSSQAGLILGNFAGGLGAPAVLFDDGSAKIAVVGNRFGSTGATQTIDGSLHAWVGNIQVGATVFAGTSDVCNYVGNSQDDITVNDGADGHAIVGNIAADVSITGDGNTFVGNRCSGSITLASGASGNVVRGNYATSVVDNSGAVGSNANLVDISLTAYTPTWTAAGGSPALGSSTLTGYYSRNGRTVTATIKFSITTGGAWNAGTGDWYFSLPFLPSTSIEQNGAAKVVDSVRHYIGICQTLTSGAARIQLYVPDSAGANGGAVGASFPITPATGDVYAATITYDI